MNRNSTPKIIFRVALVLVVMKFGLIQQTQLHVNSMVRAWYSIHDRAMGA